MEIKGKLLQLLPVQTGEGKNGIWKKQDIIVEQSGQVPKKVCVSIWGDKMNVASLSPGAMLTLQADVESREFNGKWYTDVKAWKLEASGAESNTPTSNSYSDPEPPFVSQAATEDDLPF